MSQICTLTLNNLGLVNIVLDCGDIKAKTSGGTLFQVTVGSYQGKPTLKVQKEVVIISDQKMAKIKEAQRVLRSVSDGPVVAPVSVEFDAHKDNETGLTYYTLRNRISRDAWKRVSHLFEHNVELDMPADGIETLTWATMRPADVKAILS